jgi:anti-sigma regulatory factor (Ser/Thr protein kinase)
MNSLGAGRRDFARQVRHAYGADVHSIAAEIVLGELISNAVRYAPGRTHVRASFDPNGVTVAVQDSGKGFSPLADSADSSPLSKPGRGLAIVSRLARAMEIKCRDENGCCVRAPLAMHRADGPASAAGDTLTADNARRLRARVAR